MDFKELYKKLISSSEFKNWKEKNPKAYLVHFFRIQEENSGEWQIGYYHKEKDRITTFLVGEQIGIIPEQEVFKEKKAIKKLSITKIKTNEEKISEKVKKLMEENYKNQLQIKKITIIQNLDVGNVWNITFMTKSFNTINFKISAETGKVLSHELVSLVSVAK